MNSKNRTEFIEESGVFFSHLGLTRMAGRIFGYLTVTDKEDISFDELTQVLYASKSSISTNVRTLTQLGFIRPVTHGGDRKTYYSLTPGMDWSEYFRKKMNDMALFRSLLEKASGFRVNKKDRTSIWLDESIEFYNWLSSKTPELIEEWKRVKGSNKVLSKPNLKN
jgi:predicted transcriptional regulator